MRSNQAARAAAHQQGDIGEELHAMDYLVYASLQAGRDADTGAVLKDLQGMGPLTGSDPKVAYAATAMPVRYAVERKQWQDAIRCVAQRSAPPHISRARRLGPRTGIRAYRQCNGSPGRTTVAWAHGGGTPRDWQSSIGPAKSRSRQKKQRSWIAIAEHKTDDALALMKKAADEEDAVEKLPVTPGPVVPAREQLGDLLKQSGQPEAALAEYEKALQDAPGRRGALQGALDSARAAGSKSKSSYL